LHQRCFNIERRLPAGTPTYPDIVALLLRTSSKKHPLVVRDKSATKITLANMCIVFGDCRSTYM